MRVVHAREGHKMVVREEYRNKWHRMSEIWLLLMESKYSRISAGVLKEENFSGTEGEAQDGGKIQTQVVQCQKSGSCSWKVSSG